MLKIFTFQFNPFKENCSLAWDETSSAVIIDPGFYDSAEAAVLYRKVEDLGVHPEMILLTHGHFDHVFGVRECADKYGIPVYMNAADKVILDKDAEMCASFGLKTPDTSFAFLPLSDGQNIKFGKTSMTVITTPGHTPGGVCFYDEIDKVIFTGDTLFAGTIGRTDIYAADYDDLITSIMEKLMGLPGDVTIVPGHGHYSSMAEERTHNPFLQPFNEPDSENLDWDDKPIELHGDFPDKLHGDAPDGNS